MPKPIANSFNKMAKWHTQWIVQVQTKCLKLYMPLVVSNDMNNQHFDKEIANWGGPHLSLFPYGCNSTLGVLQYVNLSLRFVLLVKW